MDVLRYPKDRPSSEEIAKILFDDHRSERLWWIYNNVSWVKTEELSWHLERMYNQAKKLLPLTRFITKMHKVHNDIKYVNPMLAEEGRVRFVTDCINDTTLLKTILETDIMFSLFDVASLDKMLPIIHHFNMSFEYIEKIEPRLLSFFPSKKDFLHEAFNLLISDDIIPLIRYDEYPDKTHVLQRACTLESKITISNNWKKLCEEQIDANTKQGNIVDGTIKILAMMRDVEKMFSYVDLSEARKRLWMNDPLGHRKWVAWINKVMLQTYSDHNTRDFINVSLVLDSIHNIKDYDAFVVSYYYFLRNRLKTMILMDQSHFRDSYNMERSLMYCLNNTYMTEILSNMKQALIDTLQSHHFNTKLSSETNILLDSTNTTKDVSLIVPEEFQSHIDDVVKTYETTYPQRYVRVVMKHTIVSLKIDGIIISGTIYPMSVLFYVHKNNGVLDTLKLQDQMLGPDDADAEEGTLINAINILHNNKLIIDNMLVVPKHCVILKEKLSKTVKAEKMTDVGMNREMVLICYIMKSAKLFRYESEVTSDILFDDVLTRLTLFKPSRDDFEKCLTKCIQREVLFKQGDHYFFIEP